MLPTLLAAHVRGESCRKPQKPLSLNALLFGPPGLPHAEITEATSFKEPNSDEQGDFVPPDVVLPVTATAVEPVSLPDPSYDSQMIWQQKLREQNIEKCLTLLRMLEQNPKGPWSNSVPNTSGPASSDLCASTSNSDHQFEVSNTSSVACTSSLQDGNAKASGLILPNETTSDSSLPRAAVLATHQHSPDSPSDPFLEVDFARPQTFEGILATLVKGLMPVMSGQHSLTAGKNFCAFCGRSTCAESAEVRADSTFL